MAAEYVIGVDVGGTRMKSGAVTSAGQHSPNRTVPTGFAKSAEVLLEAVVSEIERIMRAQGVPPKAIGLGFPGAVEPHQGVVLLPGKLQLEGFPIVPRLVDRLGIPTIADNDGRLSIMAESEYGLARDHKWAVSITLGTGVGSGVMLDGQVLRDPHLQFGTQASHIVQQTRSNRWCITNAPGTANILCSAPALVHMVRDGLMRGIPSTLNSAYHDNPHSIDFEAVIEGVVNNDDLCRRALSVWRRELGWFLVSVARMYTPEIIILSGGATQAASHFLTEVAAHVNRHLYRYPPGVELPVVVSELNEYAGVLGAAALAWSHVRE